MVVELGYEQVLLPVPGAVNPDGTPVEVPIWSRRFMEAVSSKKVIVPDDFRDSSQFDAAPWLAVRGMIPIPTAKKLKWTIPPDFEGSTEKDEHLFQHGDGAAGSSAGEKQCAYTKVWYRASLYDETVWHPELLRCLVIVDGIDEPVWHVNSPYQTLTQTGQLTDDSMLGFPIHIGTLRDLPDSAYVPSDIVVGEQLSTEENVFRTGLVRGRRSRQPITLISDILGQEKADAILKDRGAMVPAEHIGDNGTQRVVAVVAAGTEPRDNYTAQEIIERDYEQALGLGANQRGQVATKKTTATESRIVQGNSSARAETEASRIREYFIALVRKFDALVQQTMSQEELTKILGQQGAALWQQWQTLPGTYAYDILPDSGRYVDAREYQATVVDLYNMCRKDDRVNTEELLTMLARAFHRDPVKFIAQASGKTMEPPKPSVSFTVEDFHDPLGGKTFLELLKAGGVQVSPQLEALFTAAGILRTVAGPIAGTLPDGTPADAPHGGMADQTEPINKHQRQNTGKVQGSVQ